MGQVGKEEEEERGFRVGELKQKVGFGVCQRHKKTMWFEVQNTSQQGKAV